MKVYKKVSVDEIQKLLFGPVQEAARRTYGTQFDSAELSQEASAPAEPLPPPPPPPPRQRQRLPSRPINSTTEWSDLSELRLTMLICEFKPIGVNKQFHLQAIMERMHKIFDDEPLHIKMFLGEKNAALFLEKHKLRQANKKKVPRGWFPPVYALRPTLEMVDAKLNSWFGMQVCEENESYPPMLCEVVDFKVPVSLDEEVDEEEEEEEEEEEQEHDDMEGPSTSGPSTSGPSSSGPRTSEPRTSGTQPAQMAKDGFKAPVVEEAAPAQIAADSTPKE